MGWAMLEPPAAGAASGEAGGEFGRGLSLEGFELGGAFGGRAVCAPAGVWDEVAVGADWA